MLREAACPPHQELTRDQVASSRKDIEPGPGINTPVTRSLSLSLFQIENWVLSGKLGSTLVVLSEVHRRWHTYPSFCPYSLSLLYSGPP